MVYFQCENCIATLKKKQVETHCMFQCRKANKFSCLTCFKFFDRVSIKDHTSCVTEEEKYQKGDNLKKNTNGKFNVNKKEVKSIDINSLKWSGVRKTSRKLLQGCECYKMPIVNLVKSLVQIYARSTSENVENIDLHRLKELAMQKFENDDRFVIDLSKNTIRFKL